MILSARKDIFAALVTMLLGASLLLTGNAAHAQSAGLRLMPLGDSITAGYRSSTGNGYRGPLWTELVKQGDAVDFVGSQRSGSMFDPDDAGYYGARIDKIAALVDNELATYQPNLITLQIGINDLNGNYQVSTAPARLASLIDQIFDKDPTVTLLVAQLDCNGNAPVEARVVSYNSQLAEIVQARAKTGKHIYMVNMSGLTTTDLSDRLHPNDGGYQKMADAWDVAIQHVITAGWVAHIDFAGVFEIQSKSSTLALDVSGGSKANATPVIQQSYDGGASQLWNFIPTSRGYYQIKNAHSGLGLNVTAASTASGASIIQWPFGTQGNDQWRPAKNGDGTYTFYNLNSGLVLDNPGGATAGKQFDQATKNGGANQEFHVILRQTSSLTANSPSNDVHPAVSLVCQK